MTKYGNEAMTSYIPHCGVGNSDGLMDMKAAYEPKTLSPYIVVPLGNNKSDVKKYF